jgi:hypothetical protein
MAVRDAMTAEIDPSTPRYEIEPVFASPAGAASHKQAYADALDQAERWLAARLETPAP